MNDGVRRWAKDAVLAACSLVAQRDARRSTILLYHAIGGEGGVPPTRFEEQVRFVRDNFEVPLLRDLPARSRDHDRPPSVALTFDDGLLDNFKVAAPILARFEVNATFFLTTSFLGTTRRGRWGNDRFMTADDARALAGAGHEIGGHTVTHPKLSQIPASVAATEISTCKSQLEDITGSACSSFAYPSGDHNNSTKQLVSDAGYDLAVTVRESGLRLDGVDWLALPRVSVRPRADMYEFKAKLTSALDVYERLRRRRVDA